MELNEVHNEQEHASVSLKVILLVFAVVLVGALSYFVWDAQNTVTDTTDYSTPVVTKTVETTPETKTETPTVVDETADWIKFSNTSNFLDVQTTHTYSFLHPKDWAPEKADSDPRVTLLKHIYDGKIYSLIFSIGGRGYIGYTKTTTTITLGDNKFTKDIFRKTGEDTVIIYKKPVSETYILPLDGISATLPQSLEDLFIPQYEKVIATFSAK